MTQFCSPSDFATQKEMHGDPMRKSPSQMVVLVPATTQSDGRIFMQRKDSPFPVQIAEKMAFLAQSATTTKSRY
jgi:hypothetical protein